MNLTDERLAEIRARADAATEGPWAADHTEIYGLHRGIWIAECSREEWGEGDVDGAFIAHARTDVPDLLAEVDRLRALHHDHTVCRDLMDSNEQLGAEIERLRAEQSKWEGWHQDRDADTETIAALRNDLYQANRSLLASCWTRWTPSPPSPASWTDGAAVVPGSRGATL